MTEGTKKAKTNGRHKVRAVAFGRNYFFPLTEVVSCSNSTLNDDARCDQDDLNLDPPWKDTLPVSATCSTHSTVILTEEGKIYQTGTLHGLVFPVWTRVEIPLPLKCVQVAAGRHFCLARMEGGQAVLAWGAGHFGQLGVQKGDDCSNSTASCITLAAEPVLIERLLPAFTGSTIQSVAAGDWHGLALTASGQVWAWGSNRSLQCGLKLQRSKGPGPAPGTLSLPLPIQAVPPMKQIAAGRWHSCALTVSGQVYCWGSSHSGQCGTGVTLRRSTIGLLPAAVQGLPSSLEMVAIDAAGNHCISLSKAGRVFAWGDGHEGQLGISIGSNSTSKCTSLQHLHASKPRLVADLDFVAVAAGQEWTRQHHQTEPGTTTTASVAQTLASVPKIVAVYAAASYSAAICSSGHLYCWGSNDVGQLGLATPLHLLDISSESDDDNYCVASAIQQSQQSQQQQQQPREMHVRTFDSNHNVLLPQRVQAVDDIRVVKLAVGPNHMFCFGTERSEDDDAIVGRTLYEVQVEQLAKQAAPGAVVADNAADATSSVNQQQLEKQPTANLIGDDAEIKDDTAVSKEPSAAGINNKINNETNALGSVDADEGPAPQTLATNDTERHGSQVGTAISPYRISNSASGHDPSEELALDTSSTTFEASSVSASVPDHEIAASLAAYNHNGNSNAIDPDGVHADEATSPSSASAASMPPLRSTVPQDRPTTLEESGPVAATRSGDGLDSTDDKMNSTSATRRPGMMKRFSTRLLRRRWPLKGGNESAPPLPVAGSHSADGNNADDGSVVVDRNGRPKR